MSTWNKTRCAEGILAPDFNDEVRANQEGLEEILSKEHYFETGGTASLQGILKQGSARVFIQDTAPATRIDGSAFAETDNGSLWIDTNSTIDNQLSFLSDYSGPTWTPVSTEIIAFLVAQINTWALAQTFSISPVFTKGIVANATYLQGRNEADDDNTDMIQVGRNEADDTDVTQLPDLARLASNAAPTENTQIPNKKYVDDQVTAITDPAYAGGESHTFDGGLIMKMGYVATGGTSTLVTFAEAFPTAVVSVTASSVRNTYSYGATIFGASRTAFTLKTINNETGCYWTAIGY